METHQDKSNKIRVSIIIPTLNRQKTLLQTLDSLFNQTFHEENFEIVVIDGSTDDTEKVIEGIKKTHHNLRYFKQMSKGVAAARNIGILNSKGEIIGFTDDDCIADPAWIESAVESLQNIEFCGVQGVTLPQEKIKMKNKIFDYADVAIYTGNEKYASYPTCNIFYRKKNLIEISCFDEKMGSYAEDNDLAFRLIRKGYKICLNNNMMVFHETRYINILNFIFKRAKRIETLPLFVKKNPEFRDTLFLRVFLHTSHIYPIFLIGTIPMYLLNLNVSVLTFFAICTYLVSRVFIDRNYKMIPIRILFFWRYLLIDSASIYYLVKGSIKYKSILI